jgi:hypothetical protein
MEEDIRPPIVRDHEAEPLSGVEPLHPTSYDRATVFAF